MYSLERILGLRGLVAFPCLVFVMLYISDAIAVLLFYINATMVAVLMSWQTTRDDSSCPF